jgi:CTP synthase
MAAKYIFVTGGVLSGVGKGITAASIGRVLKSRSLNVTIQKCDPYLNTDAGTLNPAEHGECFVTKDGAETDLDLGHYERFLDIEMTGNSSMMNGRVLKELIEDERAGKYLGKTVQIVPHLTNKMVELISKNAENSDVHIVEIGGTVGDIEGMAFIEAIRQLGQKVGRNNCIYAHVVYIPFLGTSQEYKSKPAQNALADLRSVGIQPDLVVARTEQQPENIKSIIEKLATFSSVPEDGVIVMPNISSIYDAPKMFEDRGLTDYVLTRLGLASKLTQQSDLTEWSDKVESLNKVYPDVARVGFVAKYLDNQDTYISVFEALKVAASENEVSLDIKLIPAELLDAENITEWMSDVQAVLVPGGFGSRGIEGKILAADYAYNNSIPYLGICLGLQVAAIAAARRAGFEDANSTEFNPETSSPVVSTLEDQVGKEGTGGTMRLGDQKCVLLENSLAHKVYKKLSITERHRHRYEVNPKYSKAVRDGGLVVTGIHAENKLIEILEAKDHPFYIATQAHPEFRSRPNRAHPLFLEFIAAAV